MRKRLNKTNVDKLQPQATRYDVSDDQIRGFICRVNSDGTKTMILRYRWGGRNWAFKLGVLGGDFTVPTARRKAAEVRAAVDAGQNPARQRERDRQGATFAEAAERYMREVCEPYRKPKTVASRRTLLRAHLLPALGSMKVHQIDRADVAALHTRIGETAPVSANRARTLLSLILAAAETWGMRPEGSNPCRGMPMFREQRRERFLSSEERARLDAELREAESARKGHPFYIGRSAIAAIRLLSLTGARRDEITGLTWDEVDLERACIRKADSKTGPKVIVLSSAAVELLRGLKERRVAGVPWVCANQAGRRLKNLTRTWIALRKRIELDDVRLHDLRHSFASDALNAGVPLAMVGAMLGHQDVATTARYAHVAESSVRSAVETTNTAMEENTREGAERLQEQERKRRQRAVGGDAVSEGGEVIAIDGGAKVITLRPRGKR